MATGRRTTKSLRSFTSACVLGALTLRLAAAESTVSDGSPAVPHEVVLRQRVVPYWLDRVNWTLDATNPPFLKEPELTKQGVRRGLLRFGKGTNNAIALIWDQPKRKLYLDLNRNLDLTDDPAGVFSSTDKGPQQLFTNATVLLKTAAGLYPAILDLRLSSDGAGPQIWVLLISRSLWQAKVGLAGEEWQVAMTDHLSSPEGPTAEQSLLLGPWTEQTNRLDLRAYNAVVRFPDQLFWLGQAFHLESRFETQDGTPVCKLEFTPQQPPLTEVKLSSESLYYAVLRATNGYTAVLWKPPGILKVPQGVYTVDAVWLKKGDADAYRLSDESLPHESVLINAIAPTNAVLGGPLTNWVTLTRQGRKLDMGYHLVGADGGPYWLLQPGTAKPPEFTVYHGGKKVYSGKFAFG